MSVALSRSTLADGATGDALYQLTCPPGSGPFSAVLSFRRDRDTGTNEKIFARNDDGWPNQSGTLELSATDALRVAHAAETTSNVINPLAVATWIHALITYTPGAGTGILRLAYRADGNLDGVTTMTAAVQATGLTNAAPDRIIVGSGAIAGADMFDGTLALLKIFDSVLTDAQAITEFRYRLPQLPAWAAYRFANGALTTDSSGNARTLTAVGTPVYSSAEPLAIVGDTAVVASSGRRHTRARLGLGLGL